MVLLGAEEVAAVVIDIGSHRIRMGYAGEDGPKAVYPSVVGKRGSGGEWLVGDLALSRPQEGIELIYPVQGGSIGDWEALTALLEWGLYKRLGVEKGEMLPCLLVEHGAWSKETREQLVQLCFDRLACPALYLVRAGQAGAFSLGKHTGLVLDLGAAGVQITPLLDGYAVRGACQFIPELGGWALRAKVQSHLKDERKVELVCSWEVATRQPVDLGEAPQWTPSNAACSLPLLAYQRNRVLDDFMATCLQLSETAFDEQDLAMRPPRYYEFPTGQNLSFGLDRYQLVEALVSEPEKGLVAAILRSISQCDQDIRTALLSHTLLIGGLAALPGLTERLTNELAQQAPWGTGKVRVQAATAPTERPFSAWQGGSILASLGTFQHLWLTRAEYQEHGPAHIERKLA